MSKLWKIAVLMCVLVGCTWRPYFSSSPWNTPVGSRSTDSNSATWVSKLASGVVADVKEFGSPIWYADSSTPRYHVNCTEDWGTCPSEQQNIPLRPEWTPATGTDRAMVVVDQGANRAYGFWQYFWNGGNPYTSWGDTTALDGNGVGGGATGAGVPRLAGVVRADELAAGVIDHALVFSSSLVRGSCNFVYPATKSDGCNFGSAIVNPPLLEGKRVQLDPSYDTSGLSGVERMVAEALKKYGAYCIDQGGAPMALIFDGRANVQDYYRFPGINFNRLRVLA